MCSLRTDKDHQHIDKDARILFSDRCYLVMQ